VLKLTSLVSFPHRAGKRYNYGKEASTEAGEESKESGAQSAQGRKESCKETGSEGKESKAGTQVILRVFSLTPSQNMGGGEFLIATSIPFSIPFSSLAGPFFDAPLPKPVPVCPRIPLSRAAEMR
jgi:hypothetical protein